jgi:hypothetical protein
MAPGNPKSHRSRRTTQQSGLWRKSDCWFEQPFAQCLPVDPAMEGLDAELVWEVHPDGILIASVEDAVGLVAAIGGTALKTGD